MSDLLLAFKALICSWGNRAGTVQHKVIGFSHWFSETPGQLLGLLNLLENSNEHVVTMSLAVPWVC